MNNNTFVHKYIKSLITKNDITIDMTLGRGLDSELLCKLSKKVYSFDISDEAISISKNRLKDFNNIEIIKDNHININKYIKEKVKLIIFNLGYLPYSNKTSITNKDDTLLAFKNAYNLLENNGYIIITFYIGHLGGKDEYYLLDKYINENKVNIIEKYHQDKIDSPITYIIKKKP